MRAMKFIKGLYQKAENAVIEHIILPLYPREKITLSLQPSKEQKQLFTATFALCMLSEEERIEYVNSLSNKERKELSKVMQNNDSQLLDTLLRIKKPM